MNTIHEQVLEATRDLENKRFWAARQKLRQAYMRCEQQANSLDPADKKACKQAPEKLAQATHQCVRQGLMYLGVSVGLFLILILILLFIPRPDYVCNLHADICTPTVTLTPSATATATLTPTPSPTPSPTLTLTPTPTPTITPTPEPTQTPTNTPPPTNTPIPSPTPCPPPPADWRPYVVQPQDTMFSLARRYGTDVSTILRFNCRTSANMTVGETLYLPGEPVQPEVIVPELMLPYYGLSYKNPVRFEWQGQLQTGQTYRLEVVHVEKGVVYQTETPNTTVETTLPVDKFGELRWTVSVIEAGNEVTRSTEGMFWFDPYLGRHDQSPLPTPTLED